MARITQASEILKRQSSIDPDTAPEMLEISEDYRITQMICHTRTTTGLTQTQLARKWEQRKA